MENEEVVKIVSKFKELYPDVEIFIDGSDDWYSIFWQIPNHDDECDCDDLPTIESWVDDNGYTWVNDPDYDNYLLLAHEGVEIGIGDSIDVYIENL